MNRKQLRARGRQAALRLWARTARKPIARLFHIDLTAKTNNFLTTKWLGVPILQPVLDLWVIQETIAEVRPALLIETGTHRGGSALFYAQLMELMGSGRVLTIDIVDKRMQDHERIDFLHGSSTSAEVIAEVRRRAKAVAGPVMVILDGDHDRDHVAAELESYAALVTPGSFLLSQDGVIDELGFWPDDRPGPLEANRAFLRAHPEFEHDRERNERFLVSHHPMGWMRRTA